MHSLYIDSCSGLVIGLLDSNFKWVEYQDNFTKKPSEVIHVEIFRLMEKYHLDFKTTKFFFSAGPGSYTGMRLAEGIAQVLDWESNNVYSFYHFDVPQMIGIKKGYWVTNAFKGQVFIYNWDDQLKQSEKELVDSKDFEILNPNEGYTLSSELDDFKELNTTKDLIKNLSEQVFLDVLNKKLRNAPYYFRTLEEEFK